MIPPGAHQQNVERGKFPTGVKKFHYNTIYQYRYIYRYKAIKLNERAAKRSVSEEEEGCVVGPLAPLHALRRS